MTATTADLERAIGAALEREDFVAAEELAAAYRAAVSAHESPTDPAQDSAVRAAFLSACVDHACGRFQVAVARFETLQNVLDQLPQAMAVRIAYLTAESYAECNRRPDAIRALESVAHLDPPSAEVDRGRRCRVLLMAAPFDRARRETEEYLASPSGINAAAVRTAVRCDLARSLFEAGDFDASSRISADLGPFAPALILSGRAAHLRGEFQTALDHFTAAAARSPADSPFHHEAILRTLLVRVDINQAPQVTRSLADFRDQIRGRPVGDATRALLEFVATVCRSSDRVQLVEGADPIRYARFALDRGLRALEAGLRADAGVWLRHAERVGRTAGLDEVVARSLHGQGHLAAVLDRDDDAARKHFDRAFETGERHALQFRNAADRAAFRALRQTATRELIRAAAARGDAAGTFDYQERDRGRFWLEVSRQSRGRSTDPPELLEIERQLKSATATEAISLLARRDRYLEESLWNRAGELPSLAPQPVPLRALQTTLPPDSAYWAFSIVDDFVVLLSATAEQARVDCEATGGSELTQNLRRCRGLIEAHVGGGGDRAALDDVLEKLGGGPLGRLIARATEGLSLRQVVWVPDGPLHGVPLPAVRIGGQYLIERFAFARAASGSLFARPRPARPWWWQRNREVIVAERPEELPMAQEEANRVRQLLGRGRVPTTDWDRLPRLLGGARVAHFACHSMFDPVSPLAGHVRLPNGVPWRSGDWVGRPPEFVFLSSCRSAEGATVLGSEVYGLAASLIADGVADVVAGLWPVVDREAVPFVAAFYEEFRNRDVPTALANAQRRAIREGVSPLHWAVFTSFV